jgi:hypothetical protein
MCDGAETGRKPNGFGENQKIFKFQKSQVPFIYISQAVVYSDARAHYRNYNNYTALAV